MGNFGTEIRSRIRTQKLMPVFPGRHHFSDILTLAGGRCHRGMPPPRIAEWFRLKTFYHTPHKLVGKSLILG